MDSYCIRHGFLLYSFLIVNIEKKKKEWGRNQSKAEDVVSVTALKDSLSALSEQSLLFFHLFYILTEGQLIPVWHFFLTPKFSRSSSSHRPIIIPEAMGHTGVGRVVIQGARCCPVSASQIPHIITSYYPLSFPLELGKQENQQGHPSFFG